MSEIMLVRQPDGAFVPEEQKMAARNFIFGIIDGLGEFGKKQWRRFWNMLFRLEPGEMVEIETYKERLGWFHRKHMALEQRVFESQERFETFDDFRVWLKVGGGFVTWYPGPKGGVIPVPRSIRYAKLEQTEMEKVHDDMVAFLRSEHAGRTLWNHLPPAQRTDMVETLLGSFEWQH